MSASAALMTRSWQAGAYTCTLTVQRPKPGAVVACSVEWSPEMPRRLTEGELAQYRAGRNAALAAVSAGLGINAAVLEL